MTSSSKGFVDPEDPEEILDTGGEILSCGEPWDPDASWDGGTTIAEDGASSGGENASANDKFGKIFRRVV
jgi:hypothetical protein